MKARKLLANHPASIHHSQKSTEISDYAYERTLMMEQRTEIMRRLNVNRKQSLLLEQEVDGRVIRFRIRKPSTSDFEDTVPFLNSPGQPAEQYPMVDLAGESQQPTAGHAPAQPDEAAAGRAAPSSLQLSGARLDEANVRRMQTALALNEAILKRSKSAKLVIINLPGAPKVSSPEAESNCKLLTFTLRCSIRSSPLAHKLTRTLQPLIDMEFIEIITDKLERVLLVQNGGREVITIHS